MGVFVGNFLGLIVILIATGAGYRSLETATELFLGMTYGLWLIFLALDRATRPN